MLAEAQEKGFDVVEGEAESVNRHPGCMPGASPLKVKLLFEAASRVLVGGQVSGALSGGELINAISACIHQRMTADDIATFQTGTHPALTASPIAYQFVNAAEAAISKSALTLLFNMKIGIIPSRIKLFVWADANIKMNIVSHIVYPIVFAQSANVYRKHKRQVALFNWRQLFLIGLCGALPDLMFPHLTWSGRYTSIFHSVWFLAAAFFLAFLLARKFQKFRGLIYFCWLAACFHLLCDMITGGINLYAPFGDRVVGDSYIPLKYWISLDVTGILFLMPAILYNRCRAHARSFVFVAALTIAIGGALLAFSSLDQETFFLKKTNALPFSF